MTSLSLDPVGAQREVAFSPTGRTDRPGSFGARVVRVVIVVVLAAAALLVLGNTVGPRIFGYKTYYVRSGSMVPTIPVGALALYKPVAATQLKVGDVIAFSRPDQNGDTVSHRIVRVEPGSSGGLVTKGDANGAPDAWRVPIKGEAWRYSFHIPVIGYAVGSVGTPQGKFIALMIVGLSLVGLALLGIWRSPASDPSLLRPNTPSEPTRARTVEPPRTARNSPAPPLPILSLVPDAPPDAVCDLQDYLTIISCHTSMLLRATPEADPRQVGLRAIADATRGAAHILDGPDAAELLVRDGPR